MSQGVAGFFGIPDEDQTEQQRRQNEWKERSRRMHSGSMFLRGHKVAHDHTDAVSTAASVVSCFSFKSSSFFTGLMLLISEIPLW